MITHIILVKKKKCLKRIVSQSLFIVTLKSLIIVVGRSIFNEKHLFLQICQDKRIYHINECYRKEGRFYYMIIEKNQTIR